MYSTVRHITWPWSIRPCVRFFFSTYFVNTLSKIASIHRPYRNLSGMADPVALLYKWSSEAFSMRSNHVVQHWSLAKSSLSKLQACWKKQVWSSVPPTRTSICERLWSVMINFEHASKHSVLARSCFPISVPHLRLQSGHETSRKLRAR